MQQSNHHHPQPVSQPVRGVGLEAHRYGREIANLGISRFNSGRVLFFGGGVMIPIDQGLNTMASIILFASALAAASGSVSQRTSPPSYGPPCSSAQVECRTGGGVIADSLLDLTEVVWVGPETQGVYVGSPSIWRLPASGELVASHDFFFETINTTVQVFIDRTGRGDAGAGAVWEYAGNVSGLYWASLFTAPPSVGVGGGGGGGGSRDGGDLPWGRQQQHHHRQATTSIGAGNPTATPLYLIGVSGGDRATQRSVVISRSDDKGSTWTVPSVLVPAMPAVNTTYHCAPTPVLVGSDGRLSRAFEVGSPLEALVLSTREPFAAGMDLLDPAVWQATAPLAFDPVSESHGSHAFSRSRA